MNKHDFIVFDFDYDEDDLVEETADEDDSAAASAGKKMNDRRTLATMYVYDILKSNTTSYRRMTHNELIGQLEQYPYELDIERKALGRIINLLESEHIGIHTSGSGSWYESHAYAA